MKKFFNLFRTIFTIVGMTSFVMFLQSCDESEDPAKAQPAFSVSGTATVAVEESVDITVSSISTPGGFKSLTATVISGTGAVTVSAQPDAGATSGEATVQFTAGASAGTATIEITVADDQNTSLSTTKSVTVTITTVTLEEITGITAQSEDEFIVEFGEKNGADVVILKGNINRDITIQDISDEGFEWLFRGSIFVIDATITIEQGVTIYYDAESASTSFLAIQRDASISAVGAADAVILMTSSKDGLGSGTGADGGDWGGIVLNGNASINVGNAAEGEGGTGPYGGDDDADDSGTLKYVILKHAGRLIGVDNELNGFSFNGCGSGTEASYLQSYNGEDDGFEWFGGTASLMYAISTGSKDDSFDWTHGWRGNAQFLVVEQFDNRGDRGFEADNLEADFTATPYSNPTISNVTLVGTAGNGEGTIGMRLRHGTKGQIHNALVTGFKGYGIRADDDVTTGANVADGSLKVTNSISWKTNTDDATSGEWGKAASAWATTNGNSSDGSGVSLSGGVGVVTTGAVDPTTVYGSEFFKSVSYIGAVPADDNWLSGWALKKDGTVY